MERRLTPILSQGKQAGHLDFVHVKQAFRTFFGLVVRDVQIRVLLGDNMQMSKSRIAAEAKTATSQFISIYGKNLTQTPLSH